MIKQQEDPQNLTPQEIVSELDRFVIGQIEAKRAVATALRNRWRRRFVDPSLREEIIPHNILMIGPTGVGKTEIARRLAKLVKSPFIKVEATKFTEIGYVGRDVESTIRDLLDIAISQVRATMRKEVSEKATSNAEKRLIEAIVGENASEETKAKFSREFKDGSLNEKEVEIAISDTGNTPGMQSMDMQNGGGTMRFGVLDITELLNKAIGNKKSKIIKTTVADAYIHLLKEECDQLIDEEKIIKRAISKTEQEGIVFLDEIDKISSRSHDGIGGGSRGEVSREGVQRDLLPLIEGTVVNTKHGPVRTNHILFIASGAFHISKPSDLLPELQGRLPIRVELSSLSEEDMVKILKDTKYNLLEQYKELLAVEEVNLAFKASSITEIAKIAANINERVENIGARRLHTVLEKLLEDISFTAPTIKGKTIVIDDKYVRKHLEELTQQNSDISKFTL